MYIVVDIGGSKMRIAGSEDLETFTEPSIIVTPVDYQEGLKALIEGALAIAGGKSIEAMAVGFPGVLSHDKRTILSSEHLPAWAGRMFADDIERGILTNVSLENDAALVGLGEAIFGAGKGAPIVAYITISTGVGGARIVDSLISRTSLGFEIGGQYLSHEGELVTFESLVSGAAVEKKYGVHPRELGKDWDGWGPLAQVAAIGIHNMILHWSPDTVVIGGSMMNEIGIPLESISAHLAAIMKKFPKVPSLVHSKLHDQGGLYGGLARLK